jgi:hypothetical protein
LRLLLRVKQFFKVTAKRNKSRGSSSGTRITRADPEKRAVDGRLSTTDLRQV